MPSINPVVYNNDNLLLWKSELPQIEYNTSKSLQLIEEQRQFLAPFQEQLRSVESLISSAHIQLTAANISDTQDMMHHMHHHRHHHHHDGISHFAGDVLRTATIASLQSELNRLQRQRTNILSQMQPYELVINQEQANLSQFRSRQAWLNKHIPAAELWLFNLYQNPIEAVNTLANKLVKAFTDYEDTHLTGLSPQVRISFIAVRDGLQQLLVYQNGYSPDFTNAEQRKNYLRLTGFLWDMYSRVKQEHKDPQFEKILGELVEEAHILENGDLPDNLQTGHGAHLWFQTNKSASLIPLAISEYNLPGIEAQIYDYWLAFLTQNPLNSNTSLQKHIINAAKLIDAEVKMKKQKQEDIDYHFYGRTVRILAEVFNNPVDKLAPKRLANIAEYASGSSSIGKQVLGGLVIMVGALLIAASIAGFFASFGSSSLLSAWGMALGLSLAEAQIAFTVTSSVAAVTGLGLTFFSGPGFISSGKRQGLSQELIEVKEDAERYDEPPAYGAVYSY